MNGKLQNFQKSQITSLIISLKCTMTATSVIVKLSTTTSQKCHAN